jgi:16S rRNA processing protein RimM
MIDTQKICIAEITTTHGVRGQVKLRSFTEDSQLMLDPDGLTDQKGRLFKISKISAHKDQFIASIDGLNDCDDAKKLRGTLLYIDRDRLPAPDDDEVYHVDLIGLSVMADGESLGPVIAVQNFGAGDLVEIRRGPGLKNIYVPFNADTVINLDGSAGVVEMSLPSGLLELYE